jgi:hypothetical protein
MNTATAPSPFLRAIDAAPVPDRFLPGDGRVAAEPSSYPHEAIPLSVADFENTRETLRAATERMARIQAEEEAESRRREELLLFEREVNRFETELVSTREHARKLEEFLALEGENSRECAQAIHRTVQDLHTQMAELERVKPDNWSISRMNVELDHAMDLLDEVERQVETSLERLDAGMPDRVRKVRNGWVGRIWHGAVSVFAFLLPLLLFLAVAAILILAALGLV